MRTKEIVGAILALTIFLGLASIALADVPGTPFQVGGHVYLDATPVSGADVTVTNQATTENLTTTTDSNGAYVVALGNLPSGHSAGDTIEVTATYSGMTGTNSEPRLESLSDSPQIIDVTLEPAVSIVEIKAADGGDLPDSILVDETFTVLITADGSPVGAGTNVMFTLPYGTGDPIPASTDDDGKARYKPLITGTLGIEVLDGTVPVAEANVSVTTTGTQTLGSITISPATPDPLNTGGSLTFTAVCTDTNGNGMDCPTLTWTSSSMAVGTITAGEFTAMFTAIAAGTTTITASVGSITSNAVVVTVNAPKDSDTLSDETNFTLESGNANVTGNFSVDVSGDVTVQAVGNVTAHVPDATTVGLGAGYEFINGAIVNVSEDIHNALEGGNGTVTITLCVSDSMLDGLARSNVQIYVYDEGAEEWVGLTTDRVGATDCHTADISGYLSEAIVAIASKPASTPPSGGGGGRGGTYPPGWGTTTTPAVTATAVSTAPPEVTPPEEAVTTPTEPAAEEEAIPEGAEETPTKKKGIPGFTAVFAIAGLLAIAYAMMRRRE